MNAQEVHDKLEPRLREMESFKAWIYGALAAGLLLAGLGTWSLSRLAELDRTTAAYGGRLAAGEAQLAKLEADLRKQVERCEELRKSHDRLRQHVVVLLDRQPKGVPPAIEALVYHGQVLSISPTRITILPPELGEPAYQFPLPENVPVRIGRRAATIQDVKPGISVGVVTVGGKVTNLEIE